MKFYGKYSFISFFLRCSLTFHCNTYVLYYCDDIYTICMCYINNNIENKNYFYIYNIFIHFN